LQSTKIAGLSILSNTFIVNCFCDCFFSVRISLRPQKMERYLFKLAKKGNREAFGDLVDMYKDSVYTLVHQMVYDPVEAEKIVIRSFLLFHSQLDSLPVETKPSTVIYQISIKLCTEKIKSVDKPEKEQDNQHPLLGSDPKMDMSDLISKFVQAIQGMSIIHKTVVILKYVMKLSLTEIGIFYR
jgi:RNA polymerase sigma-70 factor, ECF subfamily